MANMAQMILPIIVDGALSNFRRYLEAQAKLVMRGQGGGPPLVIRGQRLPKPRPPRHVNWLA